MALSLLAYRVRRGEFQGRCGSLFHIGGIDKVREYLSLLEEVLKSLCLVVSLEERLWWALIGISPVERFFLNCSTINITTYNFLVIGSWRGTLDWCDRLLSLHFHLLAFISGKDEVRVLCFVHWRGR